MTARAARVAGAILVTALAARWSVTLPGLVPQTLQTLAVLTVGAVLGAREGLVAMLAYLALGALGVPVFAAGTAGWERLVGPTAGYLVSFPIAAWLVGVAANRGLTRRIVPALGVMVLGHVLILGLGWGWLSRSVGGAEAYQEGVAPFLGGMLLKSAVGALLAAIAARGWLSRRKGSR